MSNNNSESIISRLSTLQALISSACQASNRDSADVALLAVTKTHAVQAVQTAYIAGLRDFGENYVQEGVDKIVALQQLVANHQAKWHFIGPLQSNKTRLVAEHFDWVHSIDRLKIAQRLSEQRPSELAPLNVCIQVNISDESSKTGCTIDQAQALADEISQLKHLCLRGLMAIPAPIDPNANEQAQQMPFIALAQLFQSIKSHLPSSAQAQFDTLSMGMSDDFAHAIAAGSTMIRIGSALFGSRNYS